MYLFFLDIAITQLIDGISIIILGSAIMDWIVIEDIIWRHSHTLVCVLMLPFISTVLTVIIRDVKSRVSSVVNRML